MAKLFAGKFNLDALPNPQKPKERLEQGATDVVRQRIVQQQDVTLPQTRTITKQISLADRLKQPSFTTGKQNPLEQIGKVSIVNPVRIDTKPIVFRQGVIESAYNERLNSYINVNMNYYRDLEINQGSVSIQKNVKPVNQGTTSSSAGELISLVNVKRPVRTVNQGSVQISKKIPVLPKTSPTKVDSLLDWAGRFRKSFIVDPEIKVKPVNKGDQTIDPKIQVNRTSEESFITDPNLEIKLPKQKVLTDPETPITPTRDDEFIVNPKTPIFKTSEESFIVDPKINVDNTNQATGNVTIPQINYSLGIIPDEFITIPRINFPLFVNLNVELQGPDVKVIKIQPIQNPLSRHGTAVGIFLFEQFDNKIDFAIEPQFYLFNPTAIFPSFSPTQIPVAGFVFSPFTLFPSDSIPYLPEPVLPSEVLYDPTTVYPENQEPLPYNSLPLNEYTPEERYSKESNGGDNSNLKFAAETGYYTDRYNVPGASIVEDKYLGRDWIATNGEYVDPGGYKTLNYQQIQRKAKDPQEAKKDFTVELGLNKNPIENWTTRLGMPDNDADTINRSVTANAQDLVKIKIESVRDDIVLQFRSYLTAFNESISTQYADANYIGRPDTLKVFKGTQISVGIGFLVPVMSSKELKVVYQKLEQLIKSTTMGKLADGSPYLDGPFVKLTVGGWLVKTPVIISSLKFETNPTEYSWDIVYEVPQIVDVSMDCVVLSDNTGKGMLYSGNYIGFGK